MLDRVRGGSREALDLLFGRFAGKLLALIRLRMDRRLRARIESRDILQLTLVKAFERIAEFRSSETASFMAWLARIAENEIRDQAAFHRRRRRDADRELPLDEAAALGDAGLVARVRSATSRLILDDELRRLERALEALDEHYREVILLRRFEELSFTEIGRRLGKSPDAARMLFSRAMAALTVEMNARSE
ncbi:MAG: sigma-70 family RNA polymerase sigma factor [bacterium]|nr:sigma-70 family RNA polymerase sigma factor [bacterium]